MRATSLLLILIQFLVPSLVGAGDDLTAREMMEFGLEAAKRGLWREAAFRWERSLERIPDNAHLRNNLAVAYESLGDLDRAEIEYKEALRLDPKNKEIRDNYESFVEIHRPERDRGGRDVPVASHDAGS